MYEAKPTVLQLVKIVHWLITFVVFPVEVVQLKEILLWLLHVNLVKLFFQFIKGFKVQVTHDPSSNCTLVVSVDKIFPLLRFLLMVKLYINLNFAHFLAFFVDFEVIKKNKKKAQHTSFLHKY